MAKNVQKNDQKIQTQTEKVKQNLKLNKIKQNLQL
jgi:hypothetical protein